MPAQVPERYLPEPVPVPAGEMTPGEPRVAFRHPFPIGKFAFAQWDYCHRAGGGAHRPVISTGAEKSPSGGQEISPLRA